MEEQTEKYVHYIGPEWQKNQHTIVNMSLPISFNMLFGCSKEPSNRDGSFEYQQHMFCFRKKKINFQIRTLIWRPVTVQAEASMSY